MVGGKVEGETEGKEKDDDDDDDGEKNHIVRNSYKE